MMVSSLLPLLSLLLLPPLLPAEGSGVVTPPSGRSVQPPVTKLPIPPPNHLRVDGLPASCGLGASTRPAFTAVVDRSANGPDDILLGLRFVVTHRNATVVWDSGFVRPGAGSGAVCGVSLQPGASFLLRAQWKAADGRVSPAASGCFTTA